MCDAGTVTSQAIGLPLDQYYYYFVVVVVVIIIDKTFVSDKKVYLIVIATSL